MVAYPKDWVEGNLRDYLKPVPFFQYLKEPQIVGLYPVIQQGEKPIVGFSNGSAYKNFSNTILFGDHTLSLYKPTNEFFIATDGVKILDCEGIDRDFVYYWLSNNMPKSEGYKRHFSIVKNLKLTIPHSIKEQQAIAETLSTFDEYLENLTKLIEKKKAIRDGALVDLVTGKTRLDEFEDEWQDVNFNDVIVPKARIGWQGLKKDEYLPKGPCYLIGGTDFDNGKVSLENVSYVSEQRYEMDSNIQVSAGDVLVTKDGTIGKVAIVPEIDKPATLNSGVFVFRTKRDLNPSYLYWVLMSSVFIKFIEELSAGSTIKHLYQKDLKKFSFSLPTDIAEQQAIASVLTVMDEEINSLEQEKNKIIQLRDGAMDDLLTGKIRLV